jgi:hypothetical protein
LLSNVRVDWLCQSRDGKPVPQGAVGLIYYTPDEIPVLMRDLVDNYDHYLATARVFAPEWFRRHNAVELINTLGARAPQTVRQQ